jgi:RNA polymerase sigma-70 factor (ECF subfamily)
MEKSEFAARTERLKVRLYKTAFIYLDSESMALDAVDEAVYRGLRALNKLRNPEYFETWMTRILINECKKELRRRKREQPLETLPEESAEHYDPLPLKEAIGKLPKDLKDVIILRYFSELTLAQTAEILGIPQGTAATRQRRALSLLRLELSEEEVMNDESSGRIQYSHE